jgi:hypothetical protein
MNPFRSHRSRMSGAMIAGCSLLITTGCAAFAPVDAASARSVGEARVLLTERGTLELGTRIGPSIVAVDGRIMTATDTSVVIAMSQVLSRSGETQVWTGEPLSVPLDYVRGYERRQSSVKRTLLLTAGLLAGAAIVGIGFNAGSSGSNGRDQSGGTAR